MYDFTLHLEEPDLPTTGRAAFTFPTGLAIWSVGTIDDWMLALRFVSRDGVPILSEMRVFPVESDTGEDHTPTEWTGSPDAVPGNGLQAAFVKNLALGRIEGQVRQALSDHHHPVWQGDRNSYDNEPPDHYMEWLDLTSRSSIDPKRTPSPQRPGRPALSDEHLAAVALLYTTALARGIPTTAYIETQMEKGGEHLPIASWVDKARKRGFLTPSPKPGRPGGELTKKARTLIAEHGLTSPKPGTNEGGKK